MSATIRRYWDAFCFIAILNDEPVADDCVRILDDAKEEKTEIVVGPIVQVEVVRPKGSPLPMSQEHEQTIRDFFENDYIKWWNTDRVIADRARDLCWQFKVHPRDALHLATALEAKCDLLETTDRRLLGLNGKIPGIKIVRPKWVGTPDLFEDQGK